MTNPTMMGSTFGMMVCVLSALTAGATAASVPESSAFVDDVLPAAIALREAAVEYADAKDRSRDPERRNVAIDEYDTARTEFELIVAEHWPLHGSPVSDAAVKAFEAAQAFKNNVYRAGNSSREDAVARYLKVAEDYPGTLAADNAMYLAAHLNLQGFRSDDSYDLAAAEAIFRRIADRPGPPTSFVLGARHNLTGFINDVTVRMRARSGFYGDLQQKGEDDDHLRALLLIPSDQTSEKDYCKLVREYLVRLRSDQYTCGKNMVADTMGTPDPVASLRWLEAQHPDDEFIRAEIRKAMEHAQEHGAYERRRVADELAAQAGLDDPLDPATGRTPPKDVPDLPSPSAASSARVPVKKSGSHTYWVGAGALAGLVVCAFLSWRVLKA
ncbi:MAG: hypothetical protein GY851_21425 [bacterium]|nr:hypothetical protein [bacterium]